MGATANKSTMDAAGDSAAAPSSGADSAGAISATAAPATAASKAAAPATATSTTTTPTTTAHGSSPLHGTKLALVFTGLLLSMFVSSISETIAATALPTIVGDLGGVEIMQWVETSYILSSTIMMPIYGKLGDVRGRKRLLIVGLGLYAAGKGVCGLTPNMAGLLCGRVISGLGGGGLIILSQAIVADVVTARQRGKYLGIIGAVFAVSTIVGPILGGWFVQVAGWRMIFAFTIPLAIVAMLVCGFTLEKDARHEPVKVDVAGMATMAVAVVTFVLASAWGGTAFPWLSPEIIGLVVGFVASSVAFVLIERKAQSPIIPLYLFKNKNFLLCTACGMLIEFCTVGAVNYLPTFLQIVDEKSPEIAGLMMTPMMAGSLITSTATGFIASKTGKYKWMPISMCVVSGVGFWLMSTITPGMNEILMMAFFFVCGFGTGLGQQILVLIVQNEFPHKIVGTATAANNFFREIGSTLGTSIVGSLFTMRLTSDLAKAIPATDNITVSSITPSALHHMPQELQHVIANGYSDALIPLFGVFVPICVVCLLMMIFVKQNKLSDQIDNKGDTDDDV